jgi:hypothetical protein
MPVIRKPPQVIIEEKPTPGDYFRQIFFHVEDSVNPVVLGGRVFVYVIFFFWGWTFIFHSVDSNYVASSFMHNVNLVFHEAGHIIFSPFGRFVMVLGGSLSQILMPLVVIVAFLLTSRDPFGASIGLWWMGNSFMDVAPYIADARDLKLPLLGGVTGRDVEDYHDWEYLLNTLHIARLDKTLGSLSHFFGALLILTAYVWGGYILYRQYKNRET